VGREAKQKSGGEKEGFPPLRKGAMRALGGNFQKVVTRKTELGGGVPSEIAGKRGNDE